MYKKENLAKLKKMDSLAPQVMKAFWAFDKAAVAEGAIPVKYKELIAVADELRGERGPEANIDLVVGGPSRNHHHEIGGSVSLTLADVDRFPLVVVP